MIKEFQNTLAEKFQGRAETQKGVTSPNLQFDADKAVNLLDKPTHLAGYFQIFICHALVRGYFENDRDQ